jgi:thiol-disulfide isomerase/thioredoxin
MDYYPKFLTLEKVTKRYIANKDVQNAKISLISMRKIHGKILQTMHEVNSLSADNKLEVLSDLQITNERMVKKLIALEDSNDADSNNAVQDIQNTRNSQDANNNNAVQDTQNKSIQDADPHASAEPHQPLIKDVPSLVLFFADWCGPCKAFLPMWNDMKESHKRTDMNMVKFSCVKYSESCNQISVIDSYPTIVLHIPNKTELIKFKGTRSVDNIVAFVKEHTNIDMSK